MNNIFNLNSPIYRFLGKVFDLLILNLLWLICCIPIITIGPATTAMYYMAMKIADDEYTEVMRPFFHSFKQNFLQGVILELIFIVVGFVLFLDYRFCRLFDGTAEKIMIVAFIFFGVVYLVLVSYTYPLLSQYSNTVLGTIKNALVLAMSKVITALEISLLNLAPILCIFLFPDTIGWIIPLLIFLAPAFIALMNSMLFKKVLENFIKMQNALAEKEAAKQAQAAEALPEEVSEEV